MTDYLSDLPVELINKIYDNIPSFDILGSLRLVNRRLRLVALNYPRFRLDFSYLKKKRHFDLFYTQLLSISSRIVSLDFSNIDDETMPMKIDCFFLQYNDINNTFSKLHSLSLSHVDYTMWISIKNYVKSLKSLISLSIYTTDMPHTTNTDEFTLYLLKDLLLISSTLKQLCLRINSSSSAIISKLELLEKVSTIKHLILHNIVVDIETLSLAIPAVHTLDMMINYYNLNCGKHVYPFEHLKHLSINVHGLYFPTIKELLYPMIKLVHLTIVANNVRNDMADGAAWEQILINIITFKFSFRFHESISTEEPIELNSFRSSFWLEKKRWYVGYDRCTVSGFSLLYSIPYFMNTFPWFHIKGPLMTKSTGTQPMSFYNVDRFILTNQSTINNELLYRYPNLKVLYVENLKKSFCLLCYNIVPFIDMSKITAFFISTCCSKITVSVFVRAMLSMSHLRHFRAPLAVLKFLFAYRWPNINRLEIECDFPIANIIDNELINNEINIFYHSFSHLEYLGFSNDIDLNICQLLNDKPITICNIMISHPINVTPDTFDGFITRDWLERNTHLRNFSYSCSILNTVSLWF